MAWRKPSPHISTYENLHAKEISSSFENLRKKGLCFGSVTPLPHFSCSLGIHSSNKKVSDGASDLGRLVLVQPFALLRQLSIEFATFAIVDSFEKAPVLGVDWLRLPIGYGWCRLNRSYFTCGQVHRFGYGDASEVGI